MLEYLPKEGEALEPSIEVAELFEWGNKMGIECPKLRYPVQFKEGYIGSQAIDNIQPGEIIIQVPKHCMLSVQSAMDSPLRTIFDQHPNLFSESNANYEDMILTTYILYEKSRGKDSFWYYFLRALPKNPEILLDWSNAEMEELQDPDLIYDVIDR